MSVRLSGQEACLPWHELQTASLVHQTGLSHDCFVSGLRIAERLLLV